MSSERLVVVVPCYNEEENIEATVEDIFRGAAQADLEVVALLIDDGSKDATREKIEALCARDPRCHSLIHPKNLGIGRSILDGVAWCLPDDWVTVQPGDNEFIFSSIISFLEDRHEYDLILGYFQNPIVRPISRRLASAVFTELVNFTYGFSFQYLNGAYLFRARVFQDLEVASSGHAFAPELIAKALLREPLLRVGERPFAARGRAVGQSKAFRPAAIARAIRDFAVGFRSANQYRQQVVSTGPDSKGPRS